MINKDIPIPLYIQIANHIRNLILSGEYNPHDRLPSENDLARDFRVSRVTIRSALKELERQNYIYSEAGRGSFVTPLRLKAMFGHGGFTDKCQRMGYTVSSKVLKFTTLDTLPEDFTKYLSLTDAGDLPGKVFYLSRIRYLNGEPVMIEHAYMPCEYFPGLDQIDFAQYSLYQEMGARYGITPSVSEATFLPYLAKGAEATLLDVFPGEPLLEIWKRVFAQNKFVIEYTRSLLTSKYVYQVRWQHYL